MVRNKIRMVTVICLVITVLLVLFFFIKALYFPVIYPTKSSGGKLAVVLHSGFFHPTRPVITIKHSLEGQHIADYMLTIENGLRIQEPQVYPMPRLEDGTVELAVEIGDNIDSRFALVFDNASDFFKNGLLIYLFLGEDTSIKFEGEKSYDRYVTFVSGKKKICFYKKADSHDWTIIDDSPRLKKLPRNELWLYWYSGWKENEWVVTYADNSYIEE